MRVLIVRRLKYIYIRFSISAGPSLEGPSGCEGFLFSLQSLFTSPAFLIQSLFTSPVICCFLLSSLQLPVCLSGILTYSCLGISHLVLVTVYWTPWTRDNLLLTVCPRFGWSQGDPQNPSKFQPVPRTLPNHQNATPSTQKPPKMRSQDVPEHPRIANQPKKWNLTKP